jgi:hypothetical protein
MPVHIEEMTAEVAVFDGDLPLTETQIEAIVRRVVACLADKERDHSRSRAATDLRAGATPPSPLDR